MFDLPRQTYTDYEDEMLDLVVGEPNRPRLERKAVLDLRWLLKAVQARERDVEDLLTHVSRQYDALERVVGQCGEHAERQPSRRDYFETTRAAYQRGQDGLSAMYQALENGDAPRLWQGLAVFEAAVVDIDDLVALERAA